MNLKNKSKPSVNKKNEVNEEQKSINFFKERKLAKLKDGSLERPGKLIHQIEKEKRKERIKIIIITMEKEVDILTTNIKQ